MSDAALRFRGLQTPVRADKKAVSEYKSEISSLSCDEIQGHKVDKESNGRVGKILVQAMKQALAAGLEDDARVIFDKLWAAHNECASRWRNAVDYPCTLGWCQYGSDVMAYSDDMDQEVEDIGDIKFVDLALTDAHARLQTAAVEGDCGSVVAHFAETRFFDTWALGKCAESEEMSTFGTESERTEKNLGSALRFLAGLFNPTAATIFKKEIAGLTADDIQGHSSVRGAGGVGIVLVGAMQAACQGGDKKSAAMIFDRLVAAQAECKDRWRGSVEYACERKWCKFTSIDAMDCSEDLLDTVLVLDEAEVMEAESGASPKLVELRLAALNRQCGPVVRGCPLSHAVAHIV